jgi:chorismate synthase
MPLRLLTAGESHGPGLTAILDGLPAGLPLNEDIINQQLARRQRGYGSGARMKLELDRVQLLGGVMEGLTTGAPLGFFITNQDHARWKGRSIDPFTIPRPGHADLTGAVKYGYRDLRPALERASARETTARVAAGAACMHFLSQFSIFIGGYVSSLGEISAAYNDIPIEKRCQLAEESDVRCPDPTAAESMRQQIYAVMQARDTLGGVIEVAAWGLPVGLGSYVQWDRRLDARLGAALLSVPSVKGVEIGCAFENTRLPGTQVHDAIRLEGENLVRPTNRAGGLEGGISNGQPLILRAALKPIATTLTEQPSVDLASGQETPTRYERSDFCHVPRAVPILEAVTAFILADALLEKIGGDALDEMLMRYKHLRKTSLPDLPVDDQSHTFWT